MGYKCYRSLIYQSTEPAVIVLEDLSVTGFTTLHAIDDYQTSRMIFERLAVFHAASFHLLENVRKSILLEDGNLIFPPLVFFSHEKYLSREQIFQVSTIQFTICLNRYKSRSSDTT